MKSLLIREWTSCWESRFLSRNKRYSENRGFFLSSQTPRRKGRCFAITGSTFRERSLDSSVDVHDIRNSDDFYGDHSSLLRTRMTRLKRLRRVYILARRFRRESRTKAEGLGRGRLCTPCLQLLHIHTWTLTIVAEVPRLTENQFVGFPCLPTSAFIEQRCSSTAGIDLNEVTVNWYLISRYRSDDWNSIFDPVLSAL